MKPEAQRAEDFVGFHPQQQESTTVRVGSRAEMSAQACAEKVPQFCAARCGGAGCRFLAWPEPRPVRQWMPVVRAGPAGAQCLVDLRLAACLLDAVRTPPSPQSPSPVRQDDVGTMPRLNPREEEILKCLGRGLLFKDIPECLHMSYSVFRKLQRRVYRKLGVRKGTEAVSRWHQLNGEYSGALHGQADPAAMCVHTRVEASGQSSEKASAAARLDTKGRSRL